jgi:hypothetical protein
MARKTTENHSPKGFGKVSPEGGGWVSKAPKGGVTIHPTMGEAIGHAKRITETKGGGLVIRDQAGRIEQSYTVGREPFLKISLVEGITLTPEAKRRSDEFESKGLSAEERRRAIIRAHRAKS